MQLDSQARALVWTARVSGRNLRDYMKRLGECEPRQVEALLRLISSEAEILSKSAEKLGRIDLPGEAASENEPKPMDNTILALAKALRAIETGSMKQCASCGGYVDGGGDHSRIEAAPAFVGEHVKSAIRQQAAQTKPDPDRARQGTTPRGSPVADR